jgi:hypothetical protein
MPTFTSFIPYKTRSRLLAQREFVLGGTLSNVSFASRKHISRWAKAARFSRDGGRPYVVRHQSAVRAILGWIRIRIFGVDRENDSVRARVAAAVYVSAVEDGEFVELLALAIREIEFSVVSKYMGIAAWK